MANIFKASFAGNQEVPPNESKATAVANLELNEVGDALNYSINVKSLDFGSLLGIAPQTPDPADDVTGLHFHAGARGANGPVVFGIGNPTQDIDDRTITINPDGSTTIRGIWEQTDTANQPLINFAPSLLAATPAADTNLYLNIHSKAFPGGVIRGQIAASSGILDLGTNNNDNLLGGNGDDTLLGKSGNDIISGNDGDDLFNGNQGNDNIDGGTGNDTLYGGQDNDTLSGKAGSDVLFGNLGDDRISGNGDADLLNGNQGNDTVDGNVGNDVVYGGQGDDFLIGSTGNDYLSGDKENDTLSGVDASSASPGLSEVDTLVGGEGSDRFALANNSQFYYTGDGNNGYAVIADFNSTQDIIQLRGVASNYQVAASPDGLPSGTAIFQKSGVQNDLVAIVQGAVNLSLDSGYFSFV